MIQFEGSNSRNPMAFKHYQPDKKVLGKPMKEWLPFSVCYWHTWRGDGRDMFGEPTITGNTELDTLDKALNTVDTHFNFLTNLGVDYYCFHDRDVAPLGLTEEETNKNLDIVTDKMLELQKKTNKKLLWGTANLFSHEIYKHGAATSPVKEIRDIALRQVKKAMDCTKKLGGQGYVLWGGREGYNSLLNTNINRELDLYANFLKEVVKYKEIIDFKGQLLIEPKPREPTYNQYDFDAATTIAFLKHHDLDKHFKLNLEANHATLAGHTFEHEVAIAKYYGMLGSIDSNNNETLVGWDLDEFPKDVKSVVQVLDIVTKDEHGFYATGGGFNFDAKVRRESVSTNDLYIGHIMGMDTYAKALLILEQIRKEGILSDLKSDRYSETKGNYSIEKFESIYQAYF